MTITKLGTPEYDDLCSQARERAGIGEEGTVILIVVHPMDGIEFTTQADQQTIKNLGDVLEHVGNRIIIDNNMPEGAR